MDLFWIVFLSLAGLIDYRISFLSLWDEIAFLVLIILFIYKLIRSPGKIKITRSDVSGLFLLVLLLFIGFVGNLIRPEYQGNMVAIIKDIVAFLKFPVALFITLKGVSVKISNRKLLLGFSKFYILLLAIFALIGYFVDLGVYIDDASKPLKTFEFYYSHCTFLVSSVLCLIAVLLAEHKKSNRPYILLGCFVMLMSQRTKAVFAVFLVLLILLFGEERLSLIIRKTKSYVKIRKNYILPAAIIFAIAAWFIARNRIHTFWQYGLSAARPALYLVGLSLASACFPFGSGFGTFASTLSGEYYSGVYTEYGINEVQGLQQNAYMYMADAYFPYIYGQFGYLGFVLYGLLLFHLFLKSIRNLKKYSTIAAVIIIWLYLIFACTAETVFTNSTAIQFAVFLGLLKSLDQTYPTKKNPS